MHRSSEFSGASLWSHCLLFTIWQLPDHILKEKLNLKNDVSIISTLSKRCPVVLCQQMTLEVLFKKNVLFFWKHSNIKTKVLSCWKNSWCLEWSSSSILGCEQLQLLQEWWNMKSWTREQRSGRWELGAQTIKKLSPSEGTLRQNQDTSHLTLHESQRRWLGFTCPLKLLPPEPGQRGLFAYENIFYQTAKEKM